MTARRCPDCPTCGHPPALILAGEIQAFCSNDACVTVCWNPSITQAQNLSDIRKSDWSDRKKPTSD